MGHPSCCVQSGVLCTPSPVHTTYHVHISAVPAALLVICTVPVYLLFKTME